MRPMPTQPIQGPVSGRHDAMADWIEDYVLDEITNKWPAPVVGVPQRDLSVWGVSVERRSDYYAVKVFSPKSELLDDLSAMSSEIEKYMSDHGITVVVYPQVRNLT